MLPTNIFESHAAKFQDPTIDITAKLKLMLELKDSIEILHTAEYPHFLKMYFPAFVHVLSTIPPQKEDNSEHKVRNIALEVLNRLPHNEALRPMVPELMNLVLSSLLSENEDNGYICLRILFDLHKNFRPTLEKDVQPFLDFVAEIYQGFTETVKFFFGPSSVLTTEQQKSTQGNYTGNYKAGELSSSKRSFKLVTECPVIVMFLFQVYPKHIQHNTPRLLQCMVDAISIPGPPQSIRIEPHLKTTHSELKAAQVKTVSFLTYLLSRFADDIRPHQDRIAGSVVDLLVTCPDSVPVRRELLVATRSYLASEFRKSFFAYVPTLLQENVLVGPGRLCQVALRPQAYSFLAEYIHHVRSELTLKQLTHVVHLFSRNLHDSTLPVTQHTISVRLMLTLVDCIYNTRQDPAHQEGGRLLLGRITEAFIQRFATLKRTVPKLLTLIMEHKQNEPVSPKSDAKSDPKSDAAPSTTATTTTTSSSSAGMAKAEEKPLITGALARGKEDKPPGEDAKIEKTKKMTPLYLKAGQEPIKEVNESKHLLKTLVMGMKTLLWSITHYGKPAHTASGQPMRGPKGLQLEEVRLISRLLTSGLTCLRLYFEPGDGDEILEAFGSVFTVMEPRNFLDLLNLKFSRMFDAMVECPKLHTIISWLLNHQSLSIHTADVLVTFLVNHKLAELSDPDSPQTSLILRLFHLIFSALSKYHDLELVIRPHTVTLVESCLTGLQSAADPSALLRVLRYVFRSFHHTKIEPLLREFAPLLPHAVHALLTMLEAPDEHGFQDALAELCLRMPARLSSLLPYLPRLMKPLVLSLQARSDELVVLGLCTLDGWVEAMYNEFLDPSTKVVSPELMLALWDLLKPPTAPPLNHGIAIKAMQVLGKLGATNQAFLKDPLLLKCKENGEHGLRFVLTFAPATSFLVPMDRCIQLAHATLNKTGDPYYRCEAMKFLRVCLACLLHLPSVEEVPPTEAQLKKFLLIPCADPPPTPAANKTPGERQVPKTKTQLLAERSVFKLLLQATIATSLDTELLEDSKEFAENIARHFAMLFTARALQPSPAGLGSMSLQELNPLLCLDALLAVLEEGKLIQQKAALHFLGVMLNTLVTFARARHMQAHGPAPAGQETKLDRYQVGLDLPPVTGELVQRVLHCCYRGHWQALVGGLMGVSAIIKSELPIEFLQQREASLARALLHILRRLPDHAQLHANQVQDTLTLLLTECRPNAPGSMHVAVAPPTPSPLPAGPVPTMHMQQALVRAFAEQVFGISATPFARTSSETCLHLLAKLSGTTVSEMLEPFYVQLLPPLLSRPLLVKPVEMQIQTISALNFVLALNPPLLKLTEEASQKLPELLSEVLKLAQSEYDEPGLAIYIPNFPQQSHAAVHTHLRIVCIELLCTAMTNPKIKVLAQGELRTMTIAMFFKSLTCRTPEIVAASKKGLTGVIAQQKLPKDLLQSSLRPILGPICAHHKHLSLPLLQGLARLLELLSSWFNVTLGEKLIDHLNKWLEPEKLAQARNSWKPGEEAKIADSLINLFHLLPPMAHKFLDELVMLSIKLEAVLPSMGTHSELCSPYRASMTRYLCTYKSNAVEYFLAPDKLANTAFYFRFLQMLKLEVGKPLCEELANSTEKIVTSAFGGPAAWSAAQACVIHRANLKGEQKASPQQTLMYLENAQRELDKVMTEASDPVAEAAQFQGVHLVTTLTTTIPGWLRRNPEMLELLRMRWKSPGRLRRLTQEENLTRPQLLESKWLCKCFLVLLREDHSQLGLLFETLSIFACTTRIDFNFLKEFLADEVAKGFTPMERKALLQHFFQMFRSHFANPTVSVQAQQQQGGLHGQDLLVMSLRMIILPMLEDTLDQEWKAEVVNDEAVRIIVQELMDPKEQCVDGYDEPIRIELLQLATLLIRKMQGKLVQHRKELIKFGWNHLKHEDSSSKQWAFINVCYFLDAYQAPEKIVLQVFIALLRTCQQESKSLVKEALDILTPALPRRLEQRDQRVPMWIRYTKKVLVEEGHSLPHLVHIWQLVIRHSEQFYNSRAVFVPQMVNSLTRLVFQNGPLEHRRIALDLAALVIHWAKRTADGKKAAAAAAAGEEVEKSETKFATAMTKRKSRDPDGKDDDKLIEPGSKRVKTGDAKGGTPAGAFPEASTPPAEHVEAGPPTASSSSPHASSTSMEEEFKPTSQMEGMILQFLIRMAFLASEGRDKEMGVLMGVATDLLDDAVQVWGDSASKFSYMQKFVEHAVSLAAKLDEAALEAAAVGKSSSSRGGTSPVEEAHQQLSTALKIITMVMEHQAEGFVRTNGRQIKIMLEPVVRCTRPAHHDKIVRVVQLMAKAFPPSEAGGAAADVYDELNRIIASTLHAAAQAGAPPSGQSPVAPSPNPNQPPPPVGSIAGHSVACVLRFLAVLMEEQPRYIDKHLPAVLKLLVRQAAKNQANVRQAAAAAQAAKEKEKAAALARTQTGNTGQSVAPVPPLTPAAAAAAAGGEPSPEEYGSAAGNLRLALAILGDERVLLASDQRKSFPTAMSHQLNDRFIDKEVLLLVMKALRVWVTGGASSTAASSASAPTPALNAKELKHFLAQLAQLKKYNVDAVSTPEFEASFLDLVFELRKVDMFIAPAGTPAGAAAAGPPTELRNPMFIQGLRASTSELRQRFFGVYNAALGKSLFARLDFIFRRQDWEGLADIFWLKQALDLVLAILDERQSIILAPNSAQTPPIIPKHALGGADADASDEPQSMEAELNSLLQPEAPKPASTTDAAAEFDTSNLDPEMAKEVSALCTNHSKFLENMAKLKVADLIQPLREVAHNDPNMAYQLWVLVFTIMWATLQKDEQESIAKAMILLLSREYHQKQQWQRPNVVQALLEGILFSEPQIKIPAELMKFLGKTYNVCHIAIPLLEHHMSRNLLKDSRGFHALAELYRHLSEEDLLAGLWRADEAILQWLPQNLYPKPSIERPASLRHTAASQCEESRAGIAYMQHGMWPSAQELFYKAVAKKGMNQSSTANTGIGREEMCLWEEQWIDSCRQMNQWDVLEEFAKGLEHVNLQVECMWRNGHWGPLRDQVLPRAQAEDSDRMYVIKSYIALAHTALTHEGLNSEGYPQDCLHIWEQGMQVALKKWWQLPELGVDPHLHMLHGLQVLVELRESGHLLRDLIIASRHINSPEFTPISLKEIEIKLDQKMEVWRLRLPNEWDGLPLWSEILQWRHHMYNFIIKTFDKCEASNPHLHQLGYREKAWSVNKFAAVARRQGVPDMCINILTKMYNYSRIEVQEAFAKVREQAKAYLSLQGEALAGLNLVNTTNLEYLPQKNMLNTAEIFRLKGLLLAKLNNPDNANQAFSSALQLCKGALPACWISWGAHCEERYQKEKGNGGNSMQMVVWLENMMTCYMMALRSGVPAARALVPRTLSLLSFETATSPPSSSSPAAVGDSASQPVTHRVWENLAETVPVSVWLMYIPQLLLSLQRPEAPLVQKILCAVAAAFPQALYCWLRTFLLERRDPNYGRAGLRPGEPGVEGGVPGGGTVPSTVMAFDAAKEVMEYLRQNHSNLAAEMEVLLTEVGSRFMPSPEERLLAVVHALLHRFYKYPTATTAAVPANLQRELAGVCRACFSNDTVAKHGDFVREYKAEFQEGLDPETKDFPNSLEKLTSKLKEWRTRLQNNVEDRLAAVLLLEEESRTLRDFRPLDVEMPGQYFTNSDTNPETHVKLSFLGADVHIVRRHGSSHRRICMVGSDGQEQLYLVQTSLTPAARSDERMIHLMRHLNQLLLKNMQSRRRHLLFHTPVVLPVWPQVRLLEEETTYSTYGEAYDMYHARHGREADVPINFFKESLNKAFLSDMPPQKVWDLRLSTYRDIITSNYVIDTIFKHFMIKILPTENLWVFKKQFLAQMALSSFTSAIFHIGGRQPQKILFAKNSGKVLQVDFHPMYDAQGNLEAPEAVPFRLTRNLQSFFTPFGIEGSFVACMGATAQAFSQQHSPLEHHLTMFFRDELITWPWRRQGSNGQPSPRRPELVVMVQNNVAEVLRKVNELKPEAPSNPNAELRKRAVQEGVLNLVESALNPRNICRMEPTWHPWF